MTLERTWLLKKIKSSASSSLPSLTTSVQSLNSHQNMAVLRLKWPTWTDVELDHMGPVMNQRDRKAGLTSPSITPWASSPWGPTWWVQVYRSPIVWDLRMSPVCLLPSVCVCRYVSAVITSWKRNLVAAWIEYLLYFNILWILLFNSSCWFLLKNPQSGSLTSSTMFQHISILIYIYIYGHLYARMVKTNKDFLCE